ncbi:MAG TPA: methylglyoxal synthase [Alphaproteobacteria bacterium]
MTKRVGLVAHDRQKPAIVAWVKRHEPVLRRQILYATGTTGSLVLEACPQLSITRLKSGPLGGDQQLGALIAEGKLDCLIFFTDPLTALPHDVDVKALIRLSTVYNIPVACNEATAEIIVTWLEAADATGEGAAGAARPDRR